MTNPESTPSATDIELLVTGPDGDTIVQRRVYGAGPLDAEAAQKLEAVTSQLGILTTFGFLLGVDQTLKVRVASEAVAGIFRQAAEATGHEVVIEVGEVTGPEVVTHEQFVAVNGLEEMAAQFAA